MSLLDRTLSLFGLERRGARRKASSYEGALHSRLTEDWIFASIRSANQEIRGDHRRLTARAREMARNDPHAKRFLGLLAQNVVGPHGIRLQARVRRPDGSFDEAINDQIETAWKEWGQPGTCTVDGRASWIEVQQRHVKAVARDGEALLRMIPMNGNPFGFTLQELDPDQLDTEFNRTAGNGQPEIRMGVELNQWGRPLAYHLLTDHPSEHGRDRKRVRVPAEDIIHSFVADRAGQIRAVTWFAAVLMPSRMLHGYREAELVAARTAAAKMGFIKPDLEMYPDPNTASGARPAMQMDAEPGAIQEIHGDFVPWDPTHPTSAYDSFEKAILRSIASGLEVSYSSLTGDLSDVNFSSIRAGLLVERDVWRTLQVWLSGHVHRRVYLEWLKWALTTGALSLPQRNIARWRDHEWQPRGWAWVDPEKEVRASLLAIGGGLDSRQRIVAEQGRDFAEVLDDLAREQKLAEAAGVELATETAPGATAPERQEQEAAA